MTCDCRKGSTCADHLAEADLSLPTVPSPAFYEERIRQLIEENRRLREKVAVLRRELEAIL